MCVHKREIEKDTWRGRQRIIEAEKNAKEQLLVVVFRLELEMDCVEN